VQFVQLLPSKEAIERHIARPLGISVEEAVYLAVMELEKIVAEIFTKNALECSDLWSEMKSAKAVFPQVL